MVEGDQSIPQKAKPSNCPEHQLWLGFMVEAMGHRHNALRFAHTPPAKGFQERFSSMAKLLVRDTEYPSSLIQNGSAVKLQERESHHTHRTFT